MRNSDSEQGLSSQALRKQIRRYILYCTVSLLMLITIISVLIPVISFLSASALLLPVNPYDRAKAIATDYVPFVEYTNYLPYKLSKIMEWKQFDSLLNLTNSPTRDSLVNLYKDHQLTLTTNIPKLQVGNVSVLVLTTGGSSDCNETTIFARTVSQMDLIRENIVKQHSNEMREVHASGEINKVFKTRKISVLTHIDGGHTIRDSLEVLQYYYTAGARIMTLASQKCPNKFIQSSNYKTIGGYTNGVSTPGKRIIIGMNKLGMVIDLAHCTESAITSALSVSFAPVIISSTGSKYLSSHEDNLSDEVLLLIKENQGLVIISQNPLQLSNKERLQFNKFKADNSTTPEEATMKMIKWEISSSSSRASVDDIVEHIDYVKTITNSCEYVGIGQGFENPNQPFTTSGAESSANHMTIAAALIQKGYDDTCVKNIMGLNFLRVLAKVEGVAKSIVSSA
ncbi:peptidase M19 [Naegleria gruberi]|uniref:Dipeptidase n=1 Tax=Naegleria gruberi TaxID=5762 RepID=D2VKQ5_NAEGR|nr:peptidase M19 [Naegleria gruberi]EFC42733.1 peptidase M19 [Naegleria gruberi]|eukprot:XP_002675477.1 peptidase M19 [Naegleria gruberi]